MCWHDIWIAETTFLVLWTLLLASMVREMLGFPRSVSQ